MKNIKLLFKDAGFLTEVHHITGEGKDAGVVYCEMEGTETLGEYLVYVELSRSCFPGRCGYKSIVGGTNIMLYKFLVRNSKN